MSEDITYCNDRACPILSCVRNPNNIKNYDIPHSFARLKDNPLFCKRNNWHGNQYKGERKDGSN